MPAGETKEKARAGTWALNTKKLTGCEMETGGKRHYFITGGAGFIGCNLARALLAAGHGVSLFDNLSRPGAERNLAWLRSQGKPEFFRGDVRDLAEVRRALDAAGAVDTVIHLAGQVAVTASVADPLKDFEINALGAIHLLEALRNSDINPTLIYASTNKVYGALEDVPTTACDKRRRFLDAPAGITEDCPLDFHSPYGCSKGAADQYVRDYARIYGLPTIVFRMSCVYGPQQFGYEDQGWVAWFAIAATLDKSITIYGDGKQSRDLLFVDDLAEAVLAAEQHIDITAGQVYNIGGGTDNHRSLLELIALLESVLNKKIPIEFAQQRPGDQAVFVCDSAKAFRDFGWRPSTGVEQGARRLVDWVLENKAILSQIHNQA
jgi:CDP-paratose 2-epimerase